jgi:hypothetical protein
MFQKFVLSAFSIRRKAVPVVTKKGKVAHIWLPSTKEKRNLVIPEW